MNSDLNFGHFVFATRYIPEGTDPKRFRICGEWERKRTLILVQLRDLPKLAEVFTSRSQVPYDENPSITLEDMTPAIRLGAVCESAANGLYSLAEIAASFANYVTKGNLPRSFNKIRKKIDGGAVPTELAAAIGDLQWYKKVREIRTECTHYSTLFIVEGPDGPSLVVSSHRRISDREEFKERAVCTVDQLIAWIENAITALDGFAVYLLQHHVAPMWELEHEVIVPRYDENGFPLFNPDRTAQVRSLSLRELLAEGGLIVQ